MKVEGCGSNRKEEWVQEEKVVEINVDDREGKYD
jgi:hypothetical protein